MADPIPAPSATARNGELTDLIRTRLHDLTNLIEQRGEAALADSPLTLPLNHLLDAVVAEPGVTVGQIARRLPKSQQALSQAADRLERHGLIERRVGSGRAVQLHPTAAGTAASREGVTRELDVEDQVRAALGPERFSTLYRLLEESVERLRDSQQR